MGSKDWDECFDDNTSHFETILQGKVQERRDEKEIKRRDMNGRNPPLGEGGAVEEKNAQDVFEPFCRICTVTASEDTSNKLISPCRCAGTNSHVHISCLQQWRATSAKANDRCPGKHQNTMKASCTCH